MAWIDQNIGNFIPRFESIWYITYVVGKKDGPAKNFVKFSKFSRTWLMHQHVEIDPVYRTQVEEQH